MTTTAAPLWYGVSLELPAIQLAEDASEVPAVSTIQLSREGRWMHPVYGLLEFDAARYQRFINNFDANVRKTQLALDIEHLVNGLGLDPDVLKCQQQVDPPRG